MVCLACTGTAGCAAPGAPGSHGLTDFKCKYPMYVIPIRELLKLERMLSHQELLRRGVMHKWTPQMHGKVICVSHQWLAFNSPDPNGEHLGTLKRVLARLMAGSISKVELFWLQKLLFRSSKEACRINWRRELQDMYLWMDYLSMPQVLHASQDKRSVAEAVKAVKSIPAYFERCTLLLVLAPVCLHQDTAQVCNYASWRERGWCRLEMMVALLARSNITVMVCQGPEAIPYIIWPFDMIWLPAGEGKFSCCALDHCFGPCDKVHLRPVLEGMFEAKVCQLREDGHLTESRYWSMQRDVFFRGLPEADGFGPTGGLGANGKEETAHSIQRACLGNTDEHVSRSRALREVLRWEAQDDDEAKRTGLSLLLWFAFSGDTAAVRELLDEMSAKAGGKRVPGIDAALKKNMPDLPCMFKGLTPLVAAMGHAGFDTVEALLDANADPLAVTVQRYDAVMSATINGRSNNLRQWLKRFPSWDLGRTDLQFDATAVRVVGGSASDRVATMQVLLEARADVSDREMLCASSAWQEDSDKAVIKMLLDRGCDVNIPWEPTSFKLRAFFKACIHMERFDKGRLVAECAAFAGNTALHFAAKRGDVALVKYLVEARAEPRKNYQGRTPLEVATRIFGGQVPPLLLSALEPLGTAKEHVWPDWRR